MPRQDTIAKTGREPLDLLLDRRRHVAIGTMRHVAISPERLLISRRSRSIENTLLCDEHKGPLGVTALCDLPLARGNFLQRSAEMQRARITAFRCAPWHRCGERVIDLENARCMAKSLQPLPIARRKSLRRDAGKLPASRIE